MIDASTLTEEDRALIEKVMAKPLNFPPEFEKHILDVVARQLPLIPLEQFQGFITDKARADNDRSAVGTSSAGYVSLGGPALADLAPGQYIFLFGCVLWAFGSSGNNRGVMGLSIGGASPVFGEELDMQVFNQSNIAGAQTAVRTLSSPTDVELVYRKVAGTAATMPNFRERWLVALRAN